MPLKQALLPVRLFKIPNIVACIIVGSTMQMVWLVLNVFWPLQIAALFTTNEVTIGLLSCTTGIALVVGELIFAPLFRSIGYLKWQMVAASSMTVVFCTAMAATTRDTKGMAIGFTVLAGLANGWVEMVTIVITGLVAPPNDIGVAQGFFASTRLTFGTVAGKSKHVLRLLRHELIRDSQSAFTWLYIPTDSTHCYPRRPVEQPQPPVCLPVVFQTYSLPSQTALQWRLRQSQASTTAYSVRLLWPSRTRMLKLSRLCI